VKLSPSGINNVWDDISAAIESSLIPTSSEANDMRMFHIQKTLMSGAAGCWLVIRGEKTILMIVAYINEDGFTKDRNLVIYSIYAFEYIADSIWIYLNTEFKTMAKNHGCNKILAYSSIPRVVDIVNKLGWDTTYNFISTEV